MLNRHNYNVNLALDELERRSTKKIHCDDGNDDDDDDDDGDAHGVGQQNEQETITDDKSQKKTVEVLYFFDFICILSLDIKDFLCFVVVQRLNKNIQNVCFGCLIFEERKQMTVG